MTSKFDTHSFLQVSNINLDSSALINMGMQAELTRLRAEEVFDTLSKALLEAKSRSVDSVFVVGNLWDNRTVSQRTIARVQQAFNELGDLPVFLAPGKNDAFAVDSPYNPEFLKTLGLKPWTANVHIFRKEKWQWFFHPFCPELSIFGRSFVGTKEQRTKQWKTILQNHSDAKCKVLLLAEPVERMFASQELAESEKKAILTERQLRSAAFDYFALGFGSNQGRLFDDAGKLLGAQAGALAGQRLSETGARVALFGELKCKSDSEIECVVEPVEFDSRRIWNYGADISGLNSSDALTEILQSLEDLSARKGIDIVHLALEGRYQVGQEPAAMIEKIKESFFHAVVEDNTRPNYLAETFAPGSSEARFIKAMLVLKKEAEKRMAAEEEAEEGTNAPTSMAHLSGRIVEDALYYGLEALRQKRINLRNVD
jgi:DNA repair exonuclease SbcCD nuclease subunit